MRITLITQPCRGRSRARATPDLSGVGHTASPPPPPEVTTVEDTTAEETSREETTAEFTSAEETTTEEDATTTPGPDRPPAFTSLKVPNP